MNPKDLAGVRAALWWCDRLTAAAPDDVRRERQAELRADVHDQVATATATGISAGVVSRAVVGRTLRGVPADLLWRLETEWAHDRMRSWCARPEVVLAVLFVGLVPVTFVADQSGNLTVDTTVFGHIHGVLCAVLFTVAAAYALSRWRDGLSGSALRWPSRRQLSRASRLMMFAAYPLAGVWRFAPQPLSTISAAAWALFIAFLLLNILFLLARMTVAVGRRLDLGKVPS